MKPVTLSRSAGWLLRVILIGSCAEQAQPSGSTPEWEPCDPLAAHELPVELQTIIAAGADMHGTIYLVDRTSHDEYRLFVSRDHTLYRKRIQGSGESGSSDFSWQFEADGMSQRLVVHKAGDEVTGIALAPPDQRTFFDELDDSAERLTPVDPQAVAELEVRNLPGEVEVEFVADADNGARIVVTRPRDDWTYEDFKVFYGTHGQLSERVTSFAGTRSYRAFDFIVDGATWHVTFASSLAPAIESKLDTDTGSFDLTLVDPALPSPDDRFECLTHS